MSTAKPVEIGNLYTGTVSPAGDVDYYKFTVPSNGNVTATLTSPQNFNADIGIYDQSGYNYSFAYYKDNGAGAVDVSNVQPSKGPAVDDDGTIYAVNDVLNQSDGSIAWSTDTGAPISSIAAYGNGTLYFRNETGKVLALDPASGSKKWEKATGTQYTAVPTVTGIRVREEPEKLYV